ncbi:MAG: dockerin type I domain-containing protein [Candidatus Bathyarchaeota archaeon]|nr:dockerin type I domain-containing protein [Candidatus Bathyarchaeota archaeon]
MTILGDVNGDRDVDIFDIVLMAGIYGMTEKDQQFIANCDIDGDGDIDIFDVVIAAGNYGQNW